MPRDEVRLRHMLDAARKALEFMTGLSREDLRYGRAAAPGGRPAIGDRRGSGPARACRDQGGPPRDSLARNCRDPRPSDTRLFRSGHGCRLVNCHRRPAGADPVAPRHPGIGALREPWPRRFISCSTCSPCRSGWTAPRRQRWLAGCGPRVRARLRSAGREDTGDVNVGVWTADAVDPAVPLNQPHRVPRQVRRDSLACLARIACTEETERVLPAEDPLTFAVAAGGLTLVALLASWLPRYRLRGSIRWSRSAARSEWRDSQPGRTTHPSERAA